MKELRELIDVNLKNLKDMAFDDPAREALAKETNDLIARYNEQLKDQTEGENAKLEGYLRLGTEVAKVVISGALTLVVIKSVMSFEQTGSFNRTILGFIPKIKI